MTAYLYAICDRQTAPLPQQLGLDDEALDEVIFRDIAAVISRHGGASVPAAAGTLWRHEQVLEALMGARAVLPVRFGTLLASPQEAEQMLREGYPAFIEDITRVRDHVEIGIRFLVPLEPRPLSLPPRAGGVQARHSGSGNAESHPSSEGEAAPGTAYLRATLAREQTRREQRRAGIEIVREACRGLAGHASACKLDDKAGDASAVSAAFLVHRGGLASFRQQVAKLAVAHRELALLCTGPWPAYSFVSASSSQPAAKAVRNYVH